MSLEERSKYVDSMQEFVNASFSVFNNICSILNWCEADFKCSDPENVQCPLDKGHWVPRGKFSKHMKVCTLKRDGYSESDILLPPSNGDDKTSIKIDLETRKKILSSAFFANPTLKLGVENILEDQRPVPKSVDRCVSDFTVDERRVLYDFAVSQTSKPIADRNIQDVHLFENIGRTSTEPAKTTKTLKEIMIEMRNAKRRRVSYRGKKVKAKSRSHTQTLKNLIETQMDIFKEMRGEDPTGNENESTVQNKSPDADTFHESEILERPRQLYEKVNMSSDRWGDLGDWVSKYDKKNERDDYWSISEKYKPKHYGYHESAEKFSDRRRKTDRGYRDSERSTFHKRKRSSSPVSVKLETKSDSFCHPSSFSREKEEKFRDSEKNTFHKRKRSSSPVFVKLETENDSLCHPSSFSREKEEKFKNELRDDHGKGKDSKSRNSLDYQYQIYEKKPSSKDEERKKDRNFIKREYRSQSRNHSRSRSRSRDRSHSRSGNCSRSKHKKHKSGRKKKKHGGRSEERESYNKHRRHGSYSDESEEKYDKHSQDSSSECKHHSRSKKKKRKKNKE